MKLNQFIFYFLLISTTNTLTNQLPYPYNTITILQPDMHGWFPNSNKAMLTNFIKKISPKIIVEVGVWLGKSSIYMAQIMPDDCVLYSIDNWKGQKYYDPKTLSPEIALRLPHAYEQFLSNVIHSNLTDKIIPIKMDSYEAAQTLDINPDLVYIDGSHEEEDVFNDICEWSKKITKSGIICGDDYGASAVKRGIERAAKKLNFTIKTDGCFWYIVANN